MTNRTTFYFEDLKRGYRLKDPGIHEM